MHMYGTYMRCRTSRPRSVRVHVDARKYIENRVPFDVRGRTKIERSVKSVENINYGAND